MTISNSERFLKNKPAPSEQISSKGAKDLSEYRRGVLNTEANQSGPSSGESYNLTPASVASASYGIKKSAAGGFGENGIGHMGAGFSQGPGSTIKQLPAFYSPLMMSSNMNLPRDRATINAWCRSYFALQPFVQNAINLHSTYPISKLNIKCHNKKIEKFFNDMIEEIDLMNVCSQIAQEYWLLGEAFVYAELDENQAKWSRLVLQNPDYVVVKRSVLVGEPLIMLRPDENLRRIVFSNKSADIEQKQKLNPTIIEHVRRGENIPLDNFFVSHLARRISPYEIRGTGLPVSCFKQIMLFDQLRECKYTQAASLVNPLTLVKVGGGDAGYRPTHGDIEYWRDLFEQAEGDKNFKIFTHDAVTIERIGANSAILDINPDITQLLKEIYMALLIPPVIMDSSGDITYANGSVSLDVLKSRYLQFRNMLSAWLRKKIFAPISKLNDFYEYKDGTKELIVPEVEFSHMSLFETSDYINVLVQLTTAQVPKVSQHTLYKSLGLDYEDEIRQIRKENIEIAIQQKEVASLGRMNLNELRTLDPNDADISEVVEPALPGTSPYSSETGAPGGSPGSPGGGADMGLGGLPGLSPPSGGGGGAGLGGGPSPGSTPSAPSAGGGAAPPSSPTP